MCGRPYCKHDHSVIFNSKKYKNCIITLRECSDEVNGKSLCSDIWRGFILKVSIDFSKQDFKSISHTVLIIILSSIFFMIKTIVVCLEPKTLNIFNSVSKCTIGIINKMKDTIS